MKSGERMPDIKKAPDWSPQNRAFLVDGRRKVWGQAEVIRVLVPGSNPPRYVYPAE